MAYRKGVLSASEKEFILANASRLTADAIGGKLNRRPDLIRRFIKENYVPLSATGTAESVEATIRKELRESQEWLRLKDEFTPEELVLFEEKYTKTMAQFKGDVLATEETQIMQAIKFEILMSRNLMARQRAIQDIGRIEKQLGAFLRGYPDGIAGMTADERRDLISLEGNLTAARESEMSRTGEYTKLQEQHVRLMKELKGTRDQRIRDVESSKESFLGLLKSLQRREVADRQGREAELVRMAAAREYERLGASHEYEDGTMDRPILSAETL